MDPVIAISVVSGILTFVDHAAKILKLAWTLYNSVEGSSEETEVRLKLAQSMSDQSKRIIPANQPVLTEEDQAIVTLAQECNKLSNDITKELRKLKPKRRRSKTQSVLAALKTPLADPKISDLEKQLQRCRDQLHFHITSLSSENLKDLLTVSKKDGARLTQLEVSVNQLRQALQDINSKEVQTISDYALGHLKHLLSLGEAALNEVAQDRILRGIKAGFEDMHYRYQSIDRPFGDTFEWIFDLGGRSAEAAKFTKWLSSGDGIFHICGKLGSGKSTLMKKLCGHNRTRAELKKWAYAKGDRELIMSNFFFYALGSDSRQRSLMGLFRTLLYHILAANPGLTKDLFPAQWTRALSRPSIHSTCEVFDDDIKQAYERLTNQNDGDAISKYCFVFFIDGLDEYQITTSVDRREMVHYLLELSNGVSGNFKICVSSRIENPFMDMFSENSRICIHTLTKPDTDNYVQGNLQDLGPPEERQQLSLAITEKAEGVFLWVVLVVQRIRRQSDNGARFSRLLTEIKSLPTEMDELFRRIVDTLGARDRLLFSYIVLILRYLETMPQQMSKYLWLNLDDFYFLEDYEANPYFAESPEFPKEHTETAQERQTRAKRQLRGSCGGLLETILQRDGEESKRLIFIHRSVADFFQQENVRREILDESFDKLEVLSQLKLANMKQFWQDEVRTGILKNDDDWTKEEMILQRHSNMVACLIELRRRQQLDTPPFNFFNSLDTIPMISTSTSISRACTNGITTFHINLWEKRVKSYEWCHLSRVKHISESDTEDSGRKDEAVPSRYRDEDIKILEESAEGSRALISPLFTELCLGRLVYPLWRVSHHHDLAMKTDKLVMLVYGAIGSSIGRVNSTVNYAEARTDSEEDGNNHLEYLDRSRDPGLYFLRYLFENDIVSPSLITPLAFGSEFGFIRIASGHQPLSIWQHFLCWWITVTGACGGFDGWEEATSDKSSHDSSNHAPLCESGTIAVTSIINTFIENGADLRSLLKPKFIEVVPSDLGGHWLRYSLKIIADGKEGLKLDVVLNLQTRTNPEGYPYGPPHHRYWEQWDDDYDNRLWELPDSYLPLRDWIELSRLPDKESLLELIDEKLEVVDEDDISKSAAS